MIRTLTLIVLLLSPLSWAVTIKEAQELTLDGKYDAALTGLSQTLAVEKNAEKKFDLRLEIGDIYFDKLDAYPKAESVYRELIRSFPRRPEVPGIYYRLGRAYEQQERYVDAANAYQSVVVRYPKSTFADDASQAIERCFKKNYRDIVALVDSFPITRLEFDERTASLSEQARADTAQRRMILDNLITERLLYNAALKAGVAALPEVIEQRADARKSITFRELYRRAILDQIIVRPDELKPYFQSHRKDFANPEEVRARQILLKTKGQADSVLALVKTGPLPFDSLAKLYSFDPTKSKGGDMGFFSRGRYPALDTVVFALKPGEHSGVIQTDQGFVILKVEERKPETKKKFADVKTDVENRLKREKNERVYNKFMADLKKSAEIDTFPLDKDTLALVNHHPVTKEDLDRMIAKIPPYARSNYETPAGKRQMIDQMVTERLLLAQIEARKNWLPDSVQVQLSDSYKRILVRALNNQQVASQVKIDSAQIAQSYNDRKADFKIPEQVKAREIVVKSKNEAEKVLLRLNTVSFDKLAKEVSITADKQQGGDMGFFGRGDKPKEIEAVAFRLKPGQTSGIIPIKDGFAIIQVEEHKPQTIRPLSEVKDQIEFSLRSQAQQKLWEEYVAGLKQKAKIEILQTDEQPEKTGVK